jgi:hypothetical protein
LIASVGFQLGLALDDGAFRGAMKRSSKYDFLRTSTATSAISMLAGSAARARRSTMSVTLDLAALILQVHAVNSAGHATLSRRLARSQLP